MLFLLSLRVPDTGGQLAGQPEPALDAGLDRRLRDERQAGIVHGAAEGAEHRPVVDRLRRRDRRIRVAHQRVGDGAALQDQRRLDAEERRPPEAQVGPLARLDRADVRRDAVGDGRIDGVLRDVAPDRGSCRCARCRARAAPRCCFILCAVCQVRTITSPGRPIAWLSDDIIEIAPRSCRMSSAAIVSRRMRLSAKARSSAIDASR